MARLVPQDGALGGAPIDVEHGVTLGREAHNDVPMPDNRHASRDHAKVWREAPGRYAVADLGSRNGTLVNDEKVTRKPLADGDRIRVGDVVFVFELGEDEKPKPKAAAAEKRPDLAAVLRGEVPVRPAAGTAAPGETAESIRVRERILQYQRKSTRGGALGWDLGQMAGLKKWILLLAALGVAVLAYLLARGATSGAPEEGGPPPAEAPDAP